MAHREPMTPHPIRSMTGYGDADVEAGDARVRVEIRTVNHRYLNLQLRLPPGYERHQPRLEGLLKEHLTRGHATVSLSVEWADPDEAAPAVELDLERARGYLAGLERLQAELGIEGEPTLDTLVGFRDLFRAVERDRALPEVAPEVLIDAIGSAMRQVVAMREEEGGRLRADLAGRLTAMEGELARIEARAPERLVAERDRLRAAIAELLQGEGAVDEERIAREIAHLAERWDIHEEIVRFRSHITMFRGALEGGGPEGVGKRLGFISQELLREANTLGSKANDAEISRSVVLLKEEIDRLREQLENVE